MPAAIAVDSVVIGESRKDGVEAPLRVALGSVVARVLRKHDCHSRIGSQLGFLGARYRTALDAGVRRLGASRASIHLRPRGVPRASTCVRASRARQFARLQGQAAAWRENAHELVRPGQKVPVSALCDILLAIDPKDPEVENRVMTVALRALMFHQLGDAAHGLTNG